MGNPRRPRKSPRSGGRRGGFPPGGGNDMNALMMQARNMQKQLSEAQEKTADYTGESSVGGGMVSCKVDSSHQVLELKIDPKVVDPEDVEMLQDLVIAAVNEACKQLDEKVESTISEASGGLDLGGLGGLGL